MRKLLLSAVVSLALTGPGLAQSAEIEGVIQGQIDAFLQDDFETAFTFASPSIKQIFRNSETFGRMVREGYPMVWRPSTVEFLDLQEQAGRTFQRVMIQDGGGRLYVLEYQMIQTEDGWQINGVRILDSGALGA